MPLTFYKRPVHVSKFKEWVHTGKFACKIQGLFKDLIDSPMVLKFCKLMKNTN